MLGWIGVEPYHSPIAPGRPEGATALVRTTSFAIWRMAGEYQIYPERRAAAFIESGKNL